MKYRSFKELPTENCCGIIVRKIDPYSNFCNFFYIKRPYLTNPGKFNPDFIQYRGFCDTEWSDIDELFKAEWKVMNESKI